MDTKTSPTRAELETELADIRRAKRDLDGIMYLDATRKQGELVLREQEILLQLQDMPSES